MLCPAPEPGSPPVKAGHFADHRIVDNDRFFARRFLVSPAAMPRCLAETSAGPGHQEAEEAPAGSASGIEGNGSAEEEDGSPVASPLRHRHRPFEERSGATRTSRSPGRMAPEAEKAVIITPPPRIGKSQVGLLGAAARFSRPTAGRTPPLPSPEGHLNRFPAGTRGNTKVFVIGSSHQPALHPLVKCKEHASQ